MAISEERKPHRDSLLKAHTQIIEFAAELDQELVKMRNIAYGLGQSDFHTALGTLREVLYQQEQLQVSTLMVAYYEPQENRPKTTARYKTKQAEANEALATAKKTLEKQMLGNL